MVYVLAADGGGDAEFHSLSSCETIAGGTLTRKKSLTLLSWDGALQAMLNDDLSQRTCTGERKARTQPARCQGFLFGSLQVILAEISPAIKSGLPRIAGERYVDQRVGLFAGHAIALGRLAAKLVQVERYAGPAPIRRGCTGLIAKFSIQFSFLQPHTLAATVLWNEFNSGGFERKPQGFDSSRRHVSPVSLKFDHGCQCQPCGFGKLCLCPINQPSGGSALRGSHFRFPFAFGTLNRSPGPPPQRSRSVFFSFQESFRSQSLLKQHLDHC